MTTWRITISVLTPDNRKMNATSIYDHYFSSDTGKGKTEW